MKTMTQQGTQIIDIVQEFTNLLINPDARLRTLDGKPRKYHLQQTIRGYLRSATYTDGLTCSQLAVLTGSDRSTVHHALVLMPDAYIDRWVKERQGPGRYAAVWCVVTPPENCPPPSK